MTDNNEIKNNKIYLTLLIYHFIKIKIEIINFKVKVKFLHFVNNVFSCVFVLIIKIWTIADCHATIFFW
jgi:hypothetical protein